MSAPSAPVKKENSCAIVTIREGGFGTRVGLCSMRHQCAKYPLSSAIQPDCDVDSSPAAFQLPVLGALIKTGLGV